MEHDLYLINLKKGDLVKVHDIEYTVDMVYHYPKIKYTTVTLYDGEGNTIHIQVPFGIKKVTFHK